MVSRSFIVGALTFSLLVHSTSAQKRVELSGSDVAAVMVAAADFKARYPRVELRHFDVAIEHHSGAVEVVFIPRDPPNPPANSAGTGGETVYGPEMHFFVSSKTLKIIRFEYAR
jgi:hypothetical protein